MTYTRDGLTLIPGYLALIPAVPLAIWILRRRAGDRWTLLALLGLAHITAVVALTIFPIPVGGQEFYRQTRGLSGDNAIPFATIADQIAHPSLNHARQILGNLVALVPLGIYGPGLWPKLRDWRWFAAAAAGFAISIELTQLAASLIEGFSYRITDVDDAMMNASGAVGAFLVWRAAEQRGLIDRWFFGATEPTGSTGAR
jgi:glycopeptide antibiotics resistance protein